MTNQLFRDLLDNKIPGHETPTTVWVDIMPQIPPGFYFLPGLVDPTAPTVAELNAGVDLSHILTIDGYSPTPWPHMAPGKGWDEPAYVMPPPPYPIGNIATQKRRKRL